MAFAITKGQKVALVGESGSGKSTLIKILLGFLKYDRGQINVGGTELRDLCLDKLYDKIFIYPRIFRFLMGRSEKIFYLTEMSRTMRS